MKKIILLCIILIILYFLGIAKYTNNTNGLIQNHNDEINDWINITSNE